MRRSVLLIAIALVLASRATAVVHYDEGRLEIEGDLSLALKLRALFRAER